MSYLGDFANDATVYAGFTLHDGDGGRSSASGTPNQSDFAVFKNGTAMTLDASTITVSYEPGSRTGVVLVSVDMSNDSDFTTSADYQCLFYPDETVDGESVSRLIASWSCENRTGAVFNALQPLFMALVRSDSGAQTDLAAIVSTLNADLGSGGGDYSLATDSLEAIRDRGDSAWTTGAGGSSPTVEEIRAEMDSNSTQLAAIVADTNELQTNQGDWATLTGAATAANLGAMQTDVDAILLDTAELQTNQGDWATLTGAATAANLATMQTDVDAILLDTAELQTNQGDWATLTGAATAANLAAMQTDVDAILVDTDELQTNQGDWATLTGAATAANLAAMQADVDALNDISVSDILTTQVTEDYAAQGVAPTVAQFICMTLSSLLERSVVSTTLTNKKLDGSTTAMTSTLDNSATPTSTTRTT